MSIGPIIAASAKVSRAYAERITRGVGADIFARKPKGVNTNHPAWVIGHLSVYPDRLLPMLGRADLAQPIEAPYEALFDHKSECRDDPTGSIYPPMATLLDRSMRRHEVIIDLLLETPDEALERPNSFAMQDRFPTVGHLTNFMLVGHPMLHLGQLSAWRRCMGLGPAA